MIHCTKILVTYHKKDALLANEVFTPIHAGRSLSKVGDADYDWLMENCIGDNEGENISDKNKTYNEMTSIYWAWKNYDKLGNPDYIGHVHYRRHLAFFESDRSVIDVGDITDDYLENVLNYSTERLQKLCREYDLIVPKVQYRRSAYEHYKRNFQIEELDAAIYAIRELFPEYEKCADMYLDGTELYFCNLFIMKRELFFKYCNFVFTILRKIEDLVDMSGKRMYVSEWLTGIFILKCKQDGVTVKELATVMAEKKDKIHIVLATDKNYIFPLSVTLISLLENSKKDTIYNVHCLVSNDIDTIYETKLVEIATKYTNCILEIHHMDSTQLPVIQTQIPHLSIVAYYKLLLPIILKDVDKVLWVDNDTMVLDDLTIMHRYSLDDNYIAGVKSPGVHAPDSWKREKLRELNLPNLSNYINTGTMVMNLKKMRDDNMVPLFLDLMKNEYDSDDQDVLNVACFGSIKCIPFRFNVQAKFMEGPEKNKLDLVIPFDEIEDARKFPCIIHYPGPNKPWQDFSIYEAKKWIEYALLSPFKEELENSRAYKDYKAECIGCEIDGFLSNVERNNPIFQIPDNYSADNNQYKISIIIPCHNSQETISETLKSCLIQMAVIPEIEIICVDDGSTDATLCILSQWAKKYRNIKVFVQSNKGPGLARNLGIKAAKGEYVAFMDADDLYPNGCVMDNLYKSAKKINANICGGSFSSLDGDRINYQYAFPFEGYKFTERRVYQYSDYQYDYGYQRFIYRKSFLVDNNLWFPNYLRFQDPPFFSAAMVLAGWFMAVPECTYVYRINHKSVEWSEKRLKGFIMGITDNLRISSSNRLATLHMYTYIRIESILPIIISTINEGNHYLYYLYLEMAKCIDFNLLRQSELYKDDRIYADSETSFIELLDATRPAIDLTNDAVNGIDNESAYKTMKKQLEYQEYCLSEIRKSFSYRLGLFMTFIPRKVKAFFMKSH